MSEELKPCPFCGEEAEIVEHDGTFLHGFFVHCAYDGCANIAETDIYPTKAEAIAAWNTRAQTVFGMTLDEVRQMMKRDAERERTCHVNELDAMTQTLSMVDGRSWGECSECGCLTPMGSAFCIQCGARAERGE